LIHSCTVDKYAIKRIMTQCKTTKYWCSTVVFVLFLKMEEQPNELISMWSDFWGFWADCKIHRRGQIMCTCWTSKGYTAFSIRGFAP